MSGPESDFLHAAQERGYVHQVTDAAALDAKLKAGPVYRLYRLRLHGATACMSATSSPS